MKRSICLALLAGAMAAGALLAGCAAPPEPAAPAAPAPEERLVLYTSHKEEVWWPIVKEFEERTGIWVDVVEGGTNELLERIRQESGDPRADVMFGGGVESLEACRDCFEPYLCAGAEELMPQYRCADGLWTPFSSLPVVLIYNTKLVSDGRLDRWSDLLDGEFRGRIAFADPEVSGSSFTGLVTLLYALGEPWEESLQRFAQELAGRQLEGSGEVLSRVAGGTDWVGVTLEETALKRMAAGDDVALVYPADGTSCVPDGSALVKGAPHGDNAREFLDFTVSQDVQRLLTEQFYRRPVLSGLSAPMRTDLEQVPMVDYDISWAREHREGILMSWAFYLGGEEETP